MNGGGIALKEQGVDKTQDYHGVVRHPRRKSNGQRQKT